MAKEPVEDRHPVKVVEERDTVPELPLQVVHRHEPSILMSHFRDLNLVRFP